MRSAGEGAWRAGVSATLHRKRGTRLAILIAALFGGTLAHGATPVQLYDNFQNAAASNGLWVKDTSGAGSVTYNGSQAILDMSSPTIGKSARMLFPGSYTMGGIGGTFRVTWDQQLVGDNINAFAAGFAMVSGGALVLDAGQVGRQNDGAFANPYLPHHYTVYAGTGTGTFGTMDGGTNKAHFDFLMDGSAITMGVYAYNPAFDGTPDSYLTSGTLLETLHETTPSLNPSSPLTLLFFSEGASGTDGFAQTRGVISVDNVFVSVPEPGSLGAMGLAAAGLLRRRGAFGRRSVRSGGSR